MHRTGVSENRCTWHEGCPKIRPADRALIEYKGWTTFTVMVITGEVARTTGTVPVREAQVVLCPEHSTVAAMMLGCPFTLDN
jgi:hypothetical protein